MKLRSNSTQKTAAAKAGISVASARRIEADPQPMLTKKGARTYRTRPDPLAAVWDSEIVPMLRAAPGLRPYTILKELVKRHPDRFGFGLRRTLERRVSLWKAEHGPEREVMFPQTLAPGRMALSDFTNMNKLGITIGGQPLAHLLYHFALPVSGFEHGEVILGGESFTALATGLQNALAALGGIPWEHRTDSLSAAFRNLSRDAIQDMTRRYSTLVEQLGMVASRNNRGVAHENGSIESRHGHLKNRIEQALLLRGSADFNDMDEYRAFIAGVVADHNRRHAAAIDLERAHLRKLPALNAAIWEEATVRVTTTGGFTLKRVFYSVPSQLIGHRLRIRLYDAHLEAYLGANLILTLPRGVAGRRSHVINYHHVIASLRAKPGALAGLTYRDALWPRPAFGRAWQALVDKVPIRQACRTMVGLLALPHDRGVEADLAMALEELLDAGQLPQLQALIARFTPSRPAAPDVVVRLPKTDSYDTLLARQEIAA